MTTTDSQRASRNSAVLRAALLAGATLFAPAPPALAQSGEQAVGDASGEEIIVTARRREESLQSVPLSVVAVSGEELEQRSISNLEDLSASTPNVTFSGAPQSGRLGGSIFIRGVGELDTYRTRDPAVGLYIDGVYMGRMYANNLDIMDVARVEVLRGPQGTLFGKNTSGGAISVISEPPDLSGFSGRAQVIGGSYNRLDFVGGLNVPLVDDVLGLRVSGARMTQDGYGERVDGQEMADTDRWAMRGQILFEPSSTFSALLTADWTEFDEANASYRLVGVNTSAGPVAFYNAFFDPDYDNTWLSQDDYSYNGAGRNSSRGSVGGVSLALTREFNDATLLSITAYRELNTNNDLDPDGSPIVILDQTQEDDQSQFSQELQLSGNTADERFDWVIGVYYFHEQADGREFYNLLTAAFGGAADFGRVNRTENESFAIYGQGIFAFTDRLRLTAGIRYTDDSKTVEVERFGSSAFGPLTGDHSSTAWSPRLGLDYQWSPNVMTYVSVAQGAKNGGLAGAPGAVTDFLEYEDETVWTYEVGVRSDLFDRFVRLNATAYYTDYRDLQMAITGSTVTGVPPVATPFSIIANIPEASIHGGEFELAITPDEHWTFTGALGLTYAQYDELPDDPKFNDFVASGNLSLDSALPNTPETSLTLGAEYARPLGDLDLRVRLDWAYRSEVFYNIQNTEGARQPGYGLLNARVTLDFPNGFQLSAFGTNLTDESYIVGAFDDGAVPNPGLGFSVVNQGRPLELGVSAQFRF